MVVGNLERTPLGVGANGAASDNFSKSQASVDAYTGLTLPSLGSTPSHPTPTS